jgi:hypothetical protein
MRLRVLVLTAALLWSVSVFSESFPMGSFETGNDLFRVCSDDHHFNQAYCKGYAVGVADALMAVNAMKANGWTIPSACPPLKGDGVEHGVASEQVRDVVVQYLAAHPEIRHEAAGGHALLALQAAFPCKEQAH